MQGGEGLKAVVFPVKLSSKESRMLNPGSPKESRKNRCADANTAALKVFETVIRVTLVGQPDVVEARRVKV